MIILIFKSNQIILGDDNITEVSIPGNASLFVNGVDIMSSKANLDSPIFTGTVGGITKAMIVGLANVDDTSDALKPVSIATRRELDLKSNSSETAHYLYQSANFNFNTISTPVTNKIYNVVNNGSGPISVTYGADILTLANPYTYASFIYDGSRWYNVTSWLQAFIYSFDYTGTTPISDIIDYYMPIITTSNISYSYTLSTVGTNTTVTIKSTFTDDINGTTNDGLSFKNVAGFYNTNTTNLKIIKFGNIPL